MGEVTVLAQLKAQTCIGYARVTAATTQGGAEAGDWGTRRPEWRG